MAPRYRHDWGIGREVVTVDGEDSRLGRSGAPASLRKYAAAIGQWQERSLRPPDEVTVGQATILYRRHTEQRFVKNGRPTSEDELLLNALRVLNEVARKVSWPTFRPAI